MAAYWSVDLEKAFTLLDLNIYPVQATGDDDGKYV
jgi:hypothetical protein